MNFEADFFDTITDSMLFYSPKIEIKPVHLANGLFRAVCGVVADDKIQHEAIHPARTRQTTELPPNVQEILPAFLSADRTVYGVPRFSSYTLSHASHITSDNHDRGTGEWLKVIMESGEDKIAFTLLYDLLMESDSQRSDELSVLTLPKSPAVDKLPKTQQRLDSSSWPASLARTDMGEFVDPLIRAIRSGFNTIARHDQEMARWGGKLDTLRRFAMWGCFSVYLHLANLGRESLDKRIPLLLCMNAAVAPTLKQASIQSYQWVSRSLDRFYRNAIERQIFDWQTSRMYGVWDEDKDNIKRVNTMGWKIPTRGGVRSQKPDKEFARDFLRFYTSYRSEAANYTPAQAFAQAAADMLDLFLSSSPADVARGLGVRVGLLSTSRRRADKLYAPDSDLLEVLIRASVPVGVTWTLPELAHYWADHFGILFGALGDENKRLAEYGIEAVAGDEYQRNVTQLVELLEMSGYVRRYADGIVLVQVSKLE